MRHLNMNILKLPLIYSMAEQFLVKPLRQSPYYIALWLSSAELPTPALTKSSRIQNSTLLF